jgi:hypothetical protein
LFDCTQFPKELAALPTVGFQKLGLCIGIALLLASVGCGSNGVVLPHTTGTYSNASFKGSYVFEVHGFLSANGNPYREIGIITADGNGNITAGADYVSTVGLSSPASSAALTGQYSVANDGTGQITLGSTALGSLVNSSQITLALTLASVSDAELMEADAFADGAGDAELQDSTAISAAPSGTFVFRIHQDTNGQSASESQVGFFTLSSGSVSGSMDQNLISNPTSLTLTGGSFGAPNNAGIGTASFTDSSSATTNLVYFIVNRGKLLLLASNTGVVGSGSAETQQSGIANGLSGTYVFGSRGDDVNSGIAGFATVGQFTASSGSFSGVLDSMQDTNYAEAQTTFTGTASNPSAQGRVQVALSTGPTMIFWLVSPDRAYFLTEGEPATEDGTADLQTSASFSTSSIKGQYAMVMDGIDVSPLGTLEALARLGTVQFNGSGKATLVELVNESGTGSGATNPGALAGNYQVGGSGRITLQITSNNGSGPDLILYAISSSQAYALQIDSGTNTSGIVQLQQ